MNEEAKTDLLEFVNQTIKSEVKKGQIIGSRDNLNQIAGVNSGSLKIHPSVIKKFKLIISQPNETLAFDWREIRCCLCDRVISFNQRPNWYYSIRYAVNHFHYFVCFDSQSPDKPSTKCYRRE